MIHAQSSAPPSLTAPPPFLMATSTAALRKAEARIAALEEHLSTLEGFLMSSVEIPEPWDLTPTQRLMFTALVRRSVCHPDAMLGLLEYRKRRRLMSDRAVVFLHLRRLRRKLSPFGIIVHQKVYLGYWLDPEVRERYQAVLQPSVPVTFTASKRAAGSPVVAQTAPLALRPRVEHSTFSRRFHSAAQPSA